MGSGSDARNRDTHRTSRRRFRPRRRKRGQRLAALLPRLDDRRAIGFKKCTDESYQPT